MRIDLILKRFWGEERGAVALIVGLMLTVLMGFLALGLDLGSLYFRQKTLQTQADLAAVSAVSNLHATPEVIAHRTVLLNGLDLAEPVHLPDASLTSSRKRSNRYSLSSGPGEASEWY